MRRLALLALAVVFAAGTVRVADRLDARGERPYDLDAVPSARALRWMSLGHPTLAADLWWLRTVQYMGEPRGERRGWSKLFPALDLVTDVDPRHGYAYQVGANVLAGVGQIAASNALLEKGIRNVPDRYIVPFQRAVNAMLYDGDYVGAAHWFELASRKPGAPEHLREYVVAMYVKGDQAEGAVAFLEHLIEAARDPESVKALEKQLSQAKLERAALAIDGAVERYRQRYVLRPFSIDQLVTVGLLSEVPPDPYGGAWTLDEEGRAHSSVNPRRFARPMTAEERRDAVGALGAQTRGSSAP